ncbi:hypothetical protein L9F63_014666, partial [Diploptera punctata]
NYYLKCNSCVGVFVDSRENKRLRKLPISQINLWEQRSLSKIEKIAVILKNNIVPSKRWT